MAGSLGWSGWASARRSQECPRNPCQPREAARVYKGRRLNTLTSLVAHLLVISLCNRHVPLSCDVSQEDPSNADVQRAGWSGGLVDSHPRSHVILVLLSK